MRKTLLFLSIFFVGCQNVEFRRLSFKPAKAENVRKNKSSRKDRVATTRSTKPIKAHSSAASRAKNNEERQIRSAIVSNAKSYQGIPYVYGGKSPSPGFDCSGFTSYVFANAGLNLNGSSQTQSEKGRFKRLSELKLGDLVFFGNNGRVTHVAIVERVEADKVYVLHSTSSKGVVSSEIKNSKYWMNKYLYSKDFVSKHLYEDIALD